MFLALKANGDVYVAGNPTTGTGVLPNTTLLTFGKIFLT